MVNKKLKVVIDDEAKNLFAKRISILKKILYKMQKK